MKKKIAAVFLAGILISASFGLAAGSSGYFKAVTGILVGSAGSPVTTAATAADINALYAAGAATGQPPYLGPVSYLNQTSPFNENPPIGSVFVQNTGNDGYLRKSTLASFQSQLGIAGFPGQINAGQVSNGAIAAILSDAALTGVPTAPTRAPGTSNTTIATTAFVAASLTKTAAVTFTAAGTVLTTPYNVIGVAHNSAGVWTVNFNAGFTTAPNCVCSAVASSTTTACTTNFTTTASTQVKEYLNGTPTDGSSAVVCIGL